MASLLVLVVLGGGCFEPRTKRCPWGSLCPADQVCEPLSGGCRRPGEPICGDGIAEGGESCDPGHLVASEPDVGGLTCAAIGYERGELRCTRACRFDVSGCDRCGDGIVSGDEACDSAALSGQHCVDVAVADYHAGALSCLEDCTFATGRCWKPGWDSGSTTSGESLYGAGASSAGNVFVAGGRDLLWFDHATGRWSSPMGFAPCQAQLDGRVFEIQGLWVAPQGKRLILAGSRCDAVVLALEGAEVVGCRVDDLCGSGAFLRGMWGTDDGADAWVSGDGTALWHWHDAGDLALGSWSREAAAVGQSVRFLHAVWGRSADERFVSDDQGRVWRSNGASWQPLPPLNAPTFIHGLWGPATGPTLWAVGAARTVERFDGSRWEIYDGGGVDSWRAVGGRGEDEIWVVGDACSVLQLTGSRQLSWQPCFDDLRAIVVGTGGAGIVAGGFAGRILSFNGESWRDQGWPETAELHAVAAAGAIAYAVGDGGTILRRAGGPQDLWVADACTPAAVDADLRGVWAGADLAVAVGFAGTIATRDASCWRASTPGPGVDPAVDLLAVAGVDEAGGGARVVAVGTGGSVYWREGDGSWRADLDVPTAATLFGVWIARGGADAEVYAVGAQGVILRYRAGAWQQMAAPTAVPASLQPTLLAVGGNDTRVVVAGERGTLWELERGGGGSWRQLPNLSAHRLNAVASVPGSSELLVSGQTGAILYFDGQAWSPMRSPVCKQGRRNLLGVAAAARDNLVAVGEQGCILTFAGNLPPAR